MGIREVLVASLLLLIMDSSLAFSFSPIHFTTAPMALRASPRTSMGPRAPAAPFARLVMQAQGDNSAGKFSLGPLIPVLAAVLVPAVANAEPPEWLEDTRSSLDLGLAFFSLLFFLRIPLTWYPQMDLKKLPQAIVAV